MEDPYIYSMKLFEQFKLGPNLVKNRFVMSPLTRCRATGNIPNALMAKYYGQRAEAGLIISEGTSPSPNGLGYARIPGMFSQEQVKGWKLVTDEVHARGGKIFVQLMHTGRISHPLNMPANAKIIAPSAVAAKGQMWTDQKGNQPLPAPQEMTIQDIESTILEYITASKLAVHEAGFDGVELHGANGYLIEQFLNPGSNQRKDIYGTDRKLFALKIAEGVAAEIGADRLGIRISPYGTFNDIAPFDEVDEFYSDFAKKLSAIGLCYIHVIDYVKGEVKRLVRENFKGAYIMAQNYNPERAEKDLREGHGDFVAFGRYFISNPNLPLKVKSGETLRDPDSAKFYTPGPEGYTDYL